MVDFIFRIRCDVSVFRFWCLWDLWFYLFWIVVVVFIFFRRWIYNVFKWIGFGFVFFIVFKCCCFGCCICGIWSLMLLRDVINRVVKYWDCVFFFFRFVYVFYWFFGFIVILCRLFLGLMFLKFFFRFFYRFWRCWWRLYFKCVFIIWFFFMLVCFIVLSGGFGWLGMKIIVVEFGWGWYFGVKGGSFSCKFFFDFSNVWFFRRWYVLKFFFSR